MYKFNEYRSFNNIIIIIPIVFKHEFIIQKHVLIFVSRSRIVHFKSTSAWTSSVEQEIQVLLKCFQGENLIHFLYYIILQYIV